MKKRRFLVLLICLMLLSLLPTVGARPAGDSEASVSAFGGTLNNSTDLLFDFSNNDAAKTRYQGSAYGGYNFDQETNGYWATGYNGTKTNYSISNANGTLRLKVTGGADASGVYGPWLKVTNQYGKLPSYNEADRPYYPLNFSPKNVKFVSIRFKMVGCSVPDGQVPKMVFEFYFTKGGSYSYANNMSASFFFHDNYYQTVTIPVSSTLKNADVLKGFGLRFRNVTGSNGTIYIDYIYIGASGSTVLSSHSDKTFLSQSVNPIVSGVNETQFYLKDSSDGTQMAGYLATVAPSAMVTMKASYPGYYTSGSTVASRKTLAPKLPLKGATTTAQAAAYEAATGETVYLAINADFFNMDTFHPRGQLAMEGNVIQTYGTRATPYFAVLQDGSFAIRAFGSPMGDVKEAVAGLHWLVRNGAAVKNNDVERAPRTAIGLKADGTLVIYAVDGRQEPYSAGMTLQETADLMYAAGCVSAINLDGGGSTTFATRYNNGASPLTIRNSPSDNTGERVVTSTLLLVAKTCNHSFNKQYAINADGTHSVSCASCNERITVTHSYSGGSCVCGDKQHLGSGLFFGFGGSANDLYRYADPAYKYYNFDLTDNGIWNRGCWYTGYTETEQDYTIDNTAGTLTVKVSDKYSGSEANGNLTYGPWLKITNGDGVGPSGDSGTHRPLNYKPANVEEVRLRFKLTGCTVPAGKTPKVYFEYYYTEGGTYTSTTDMSATYSFTEDEYVTVTIPASAKLKAADVLCGFGLRFQHIKSSGSGKLILDYIYIGQKASDTLLFDFNNSAAAKARYQSPGYGFINFDTASKGYWTTYYNKTNTDFTVNNSDGTLNVTVTEGYSGSAENGNLTYGPWVKTTNTYGKFTGRTTDDYFPLSYDPKNADYFQIRFKTTGCQADAGKTPRVVLEYYYVQDGIYTYANDIAATYSVKNGEYQILTAPISTKFKTAGEILCIGLRFQHIKSTSGSINIDYIAIGPNERLPNPRYTVTFKGADGGTLASQTLYRGQNASYSGATPTKAPDSSNHYSFKGWDKSLNNITANTVFTAQFTATAHSFSYSSVNGSNHKASCSCGYSATSAHSWNSGSVTTQPTCTAAGVKTFTCSLCKTKKTESLSPSGHSYTTKLTAPTCTTQGYTTYTCSRCSHTYKDNYTNAKGHTEVTDKAIPATCTTPGKTEGKHCSVCNTVLVKQE
ncbi:MAG: phosphodiester glycosidase family protein, partial [Oscillospiraceae bacterium]|nr:phosphodiester glycosidase family protein [Oscillospiraceae bacterium]